MELVKYTGRRDEMAGLVVVSFGNDGYGRIAMRLTCSLATRTFLSTLSQVLFFSALLLLPIMSLVSLAAAASLATAAAALATACYLPLVAAALASLPMDWCF